MRIAPYPYTPFGIICRLFARNVYNKQLSFKKTRRTFSLRPKHYNDPPKFVLVLGITLGVGVASLGVLATLGGLAALVGMSVPFGILLSIGPPSTVVVFWTQWIRFMHRLKKTLEDFDEDDNLAMKVHALRQMELPGAGRTALEKTIDELQAAYTLRNAQTRAYHRLDSARRVQQTNEVEKEIKSCRDSLGKTKKEIEERTNLITSLWREHESLLQRTKAEQELRAASREHALLQGQEIPSQGAAELNEYIQAHRQIMGEISK